MKKLFCFFVNVLILPFLILAQTGEKIENFLSARVLNYEQAALLVLEAADVHETHGSAIISSPDAAFRFAMGQKWLPKGASGSGTARLDGVSLLLMNSFGLKGGALYSLLKHPHYAYRELVYKDIIQGRHDGEMAVSGDYLLFLLIRLLPSTDGAGWEDYDIDKYIRMAQEEWRLAQPSQRDSERTAQLEALAAEINIQLEAKEVEDTSARITDEGVTIRLSNIQFTANSSELPNAEKRKLEEIAAILKTIPGRRILVTGHTALAGETGGQLRMSRERAQAVASYLVFLGARTAREIQSQGFGAERPIADNSTPEGMALNRRVEITILEDR